MNDSLFSTDLGPRTLTICLLVWVLHGALLAFALPLSELFSALPLLHIDSPFHQYQLSVARELWENHALIGYDPWFAAGHLGGVNYNASAKVPALLAALLPSLLGPVTAYKLYVFLSALVAPGFVLLAMRLLKADAMTTIGAMVLGMLLWWISALRWYHTAGMVAFVAASYASLPYTVLVWRTVTGTLTASAVVALSVFGALGMLFHPLFPIPVIFAAFFLVLATWKEVRPKALVVVLATVPLLCLLPNISWILPSVHYPGWSDGSLSPFQKSVDISVVLSEALGRIEGMARGAKVNPVIWLCVALALSPVTESLSRRIAGGFTMAALALIVFAAVGAWWTVFGTLQPNRLSAAAYLLLTIPAAIGIASVIRAATQSQRGCLINFGAKTTVALLLAASIFFATELKNEVSGADTPHYGRPSPEVRGVGETTTWLAYWLEHNTTTDARVLFETSLGRVHDGAHVAGYLARTSGREFIGGPYVYMHYAGFWDGYLFGQPISKFSSEDFSKQLELYNVGWIVAHSQTSQAYLEKHFSVHEQAKHGGVVVYRVQRAHSYFLEGSGRVAGRRTNRIDLDQLSGDAVTLKYHYVDGLVTEPPVVVQPVLLPGDPKPFIRLLAPPRQLSIGLP